jgi:hypothetical protein
MYVCMYVCAAVIVLVAWDFVTLNKILSELDGE